MKKELLTFKDPKSPISEIFRSLRTNIQFMCSDKDLKTILITSTVSGEGKSLVTANLAITFAQAGKKVILVDADMRKGRQHQIFNILQKPGLSNYLSNIIEKAEESFSEEEAKKMEEQLRKQSFDLNDYLAQLRQVKKMGSFSSLLKMIPGMVLKLKI